jgi:tyrosyl-tRNA synthetase
MTTFRSDFLRELTARGFVKDCTDLEGLDAKAAKGEVVGYIGYDATADSLHVGHLTQIMLLHWLQQSGNKPIALMGGGTTKIGDPSGRDETRQLLTNAQIDANITSIRGVFENFLTFGDGASDAMLVNNADWLDGLQYIPFLREIGRHFTINRMLTFDSVKLRLDREQPLTFLEFNYMILQAYDFMELNRRHGCTLQMGGSDQYGNIVNGIDLARRVHGAELFGLTSPLLTTASGQKMGKTAGGAVWLNEARLSHFDFWQYWRNTEDADVGRFLKLFTTLPLDEIARLEALQGAEINEAKKILAGAITALCRGEAAAREAAETARQTFELGQAGGTLPTALVSAAALEAGVPIVDLLVEAGLTASKGEARRMIQQGGVRLNDVSVTDITARVHAEALDASNTGKLSAGKKKHALIKLG